MWVSKSLSIGSTPPGIRSIRENIRLSSEGREGGREGGRGRKKVVKIEIILAKGRGSRREGGREREGEGEGGRGRERGREEGEGGKRE